MTQTDYTVHLDAFEGPIDLLLHLIRRAEVEITDIPIATITDQYLAHIQHASIERLDIDTAGDFLVMAATLMEIKSRMLMPPEQRATRSADSDSGDDADPRAELVQQLLEYKRYRDAADQLDTLRQRWADRVPATRSHIDNRALRDAAVQLQLEFSDDDEPQDDVSLTDLIEAFSRIVESVDFDKLGQHQVTFDDTPIEAHAADVVDLLSQARLSTGQPRIRFTDVFTGRNRSQAIGLFLALLELMKQQRIRVHAQPAPSQPAAKHISIELIDQDPESPPTDDQPSPESDS